MLQASGVSAEISVSAIPLFEGAAELLDEGIRSTLDPANRQVEYLFRADSDALRKLALYDALFDPQTSGGLLLATAPIQVEPLLQALLDAGHNAALVGEVVDGPARLEIV